MTDDMHDGTIAQGDTWLSTAVPALLGAPAFATQRLLLFITWDENDDTTSSPGPGNQVATLVIADGVPQGFQSRSPTTITACYGRSRPRGTWPR